MPAYETKNWPQAMENQRSSSAQACDTPSTSILHMLSELTDQSVQLGMMASEVVNSLTPPGPEDGKCSPPLPQPGCVIGYLNLIAVQMNVADKYLRQAIQAIGGGRESPKEMNKHG